MLKKRLAVLVLALGLLPAAFAETNSPAPTGEAGNSGPCRFQNPDGSWALIPEDANFSRKQDMFQAWTFTSISMQKTMTLGCPKPDQWIHSFSTSWATRTGNGMWDGTKWIAAEAKTSQYKSSDGIYHARCIARIQSVPKTGQPVDYGPFTVTFIPVAKDVSGANGTVTTTYQKSVWETMSSCCFKVNALSKMDRSTTGNTIYQYQMKWIADKPAKQSFVVDKDAPTIKIGEYVSGGSWTRYARRYCDIEY